jgi:hypothetical protein
MQSIPPSLAPFFQEYDIARLNPESDSFTIIERTLQFGNREEIRWLFRTYSREQVEVGKQFYLAGGTALALQIGHRLFL